MRTQAIEACADKMATAIEQGNTQAAQQYVAQFRILQDREDDRAASVIREMLNARS